MADEMINETKNDRLNNLPFKLTTVSKNVNLKKMLPWKGNTPS
jgi:hypothetical protein